MIKVFYDVLPCEHYSLEIKKADVDIQYHKHVGDIRRLTGSEHYIMRLLQAVRCGILRTDEIEIHCGEHLIEVDVKGEFIQPWPDDLFEATFYLRFAPYPVLGE